MSASTIPHSSPPPTENGGRSSASKKLKSNTDRSWITVVAVIAYVTGVATGILFSQSSVPLFSAQSSQSEAILPNCPSSTSSSSSSSSVKALNKTMEENRRIREDQKQLQEEKQGLERQVQELTLQQQNQTQSLEKQVEQLNQQVQKLRKSSNIPTPYKTGKENELPLFPETVKQLVVDYATVPRDDFNELLNIGVPYDQTDGGGGQEVILLYTTPAAIPSVHSKTNKFGLNATEAMENCNVVKVILQQRHNHRRKGVQQCIAIVPNWDSFYVHNFQRLPKQESSTNVVGEHLKAPGHFVDAKFPLRYTARNVENDGTYFEPVPRNDWYTLPFYKVLAEYFGHFDRILKEVRSFIKTNVTITDSSTTMNNKQTLVVMTVNKGQSVLFHNFVCHSRKRGIDLSHVIMFATDETALQLCRDLGIPAFYDESIYGKFPEDAAGYYGDKTFGKMMLAKIICVHLALYSNYNVLFQDVDVLWFKNPLEFMESPELEEWDMIFQDDGSRQTRFRPYSANSGFYFVRNNDLTKFFFSTLLRMGDVVAAEHSHQSMLVTLLNEFASWKGLRVKVYHHQTEKRDNPFPGGVEYHRQYSWDLFRRMFNNNTYPYIYHQSWTESIVDKIKFFQQLGMWYLPNSTDACSGLDCCLDEANYVCHFGDKPSMRPCPSAPFKDERRGQKFWP